MSDVSLNLLAIDTATEACSVALCMDNQIFSSFEICPQQHSQKILTLIDDVLRQADIKLAKIDGIVFGHGPGSFTGVRIAIGIVQGLAFGANKPVYGVSTLATMAQQAIQQHQADKVVSAIDARMSEVYIGVYENNNGIATSVIDDKVLPPQDAQSLFTSDEDFMCTGTGWNETLLKSHHPLPEILYPNATYMLPLANLAWHSQRFVDIEQISPVYLRDKVTWKKLPGKE